MANEELAGNTRHKGNVEDTRGTIDKSQKEGECEEGDTVATVHPRPHLLPRKGEQEEGKKTDSEDYVNGYFLNELL